MKVLCPRKALLQFRRECRQRYPKEHIAALFGHRSEDGNLLITKLSPIVHVATEEALFIKDHHVRDSKRRALSRESDWLGTLHSHCMTEEFPTCWHLSEADIKSALHYGEAISGIVYVFNGGKQTEVFWYEPRPLTQTEYYD